MKDDYKSISKEELILGILDEYWDKSARNEAFDIETYAKKYPRYAADIRKAFADELAMKKFSKDMYLSEREGTEPTEAEVDAAWEKFKMRITPVWKKTKNGAFQLIADLKIKLLDGVAFFSDLPAALKPYGMALPISENALSGEGSTSGEDGYARLETVKLELPDIHHQRKIILKVSGMLAGKIEMLLTVLALPKDLPIPGEEIEFSGGEGGVVFSAKTDEDGNACLSKIKSGTYIIRIGSLPGALHIPIQI